MVNIEYLEFCQGDPYFYDLPRVLDEEPFDIGLLPTGWSSSLTEGWRHVEPPSLRLPVQGWKIHVSTTPENAQDVLSRTAGMCFSAGLAFKFNPTRHSMLSRNAKYADRSGSGKVHHHLSGRRDRLGEGGPRAGRDAEGFSGALHPF